jgi:hypothetical protein
MPNQPQATTARKSAGTFDPSVPNDARASTGNGIPYFVPACAFKTIGISTIQFPNVTVRRACHQFIPPAISPLAIMYVGMHTLMPIQRAAMLYVPQVRWDIFVAAISLLMSGLWSIEERSTSTRSEDMEGSMAMR